MSSHRRLTSRPCYLGQTLSLISHPRSIKKKINHPSWPSYIGPCCAPVLAELAITDLLAEPIHVSIVAYMTGLEKNKSNHIGLIYNYLWH